MLVIKDLFLQYNKKPVLSNINIHLKPNQAVTILGPNGCGKSSLAKAITGITSFQGEIIINKNIITKLNTKTKAKLSNYIPAKLDSFDLKISVYEFVLMGRFAHKSRWINYSKNDYKKVNTILKKLNLLSLTNQLLFSLSSGQQQLVLIAQALVQETPLLIFDEPTAHLDPKNIVNFVKLFKSLKEKYTLILITHDIHLAQVLDQPILFIKNKQVTLYNKEFFHPNILFRNYGVKFENDNRYLRLCFD